ncbi:MAG: LexA family transcriptional regulator [Sphingobacteriales bacterium JAD_PAG50586_3]|nr:MAG: LexA family transcriptional regulator [Sphingobacteriales bacterium JAD_PAG50586_3]
MLLHENLKFLRGRLSIAEMATKLDIPEDSYRKYEAGLRRPSYEKLIYISSVLKFSTEVLLKADLRKADLNKLMMVADNRLLFPILVDDQNNDVIEIISVKSKAGYLQGYTDPTYIDKLKTMNLPFKIIGKHRAFPITGDSMPPVKEGSFVVGKFVESITEIEDGDTYIVLTSNDGLVYKRVYKKEAALELHSDNKNYQPYQVKLEDVLELWKFVCCINLSDQKEEEINMQSVMDMLKSMKVEIEAKK